LTEPTWLQQSNTRGFVFALYLIWYSLARLWIEPLRTDALLLGPVRVAQLISLIGLVGAGGFIWYRVRQWSKHKRGSA